ncbi:DMT family transporter [Micromonospora avicenniae]|uniref:Permease of the drug/metabolite transporter (DMT) superfamily n=1 Tax=Micromonospora avicenniae TaxID=1198245 RepID=A0A1N7FLC6_9ACTN|nr:DMT family transporter [Micromonospora avicenniae]SIS01067.1 Permease of the drug/metabolite transporter (DMT) superfamily [Micromonospora avicenniae]
MTDHSAPDRPAPRSWLPGFLALAAIWGSSFLFIKVGVEELHPLQLTLYRVVTGTLTLLVVLAVLRDRLPREPRVWAHLFVVAAFGVAVPFTLFGYGEQRVESMLAGIWNATTPLIVLPLAVLVFRTERLTTRRAVGLALGFTGVLVVLGVWEGVGGSHFAGQLMCFGAAACYGVAIPYQKRFVAGSTHSGLSLSAAQLLLATVQLAIVTPLVAGAPPLPTRLSLPVVASVVALGALGTGLAFVINMRNIRVAGASTAATVTYLIPVFAVLIGAVALGERLNWHQPVGALIVLIGVAVSQGLLSRRRPTPVSIAKPAAEPATHP